jgi:predicted nucleic acid-binding protein
VSAYLLDTNTLSELRRPRPHPLFAQWWNDLGVDRIFISAMTIGEIHRGIVKVQPDQPDLAAALRQWMCKIEDLGRGRIISVDSTVACRWAELRHTHPQRGLIDLLIAATASIHGMVMVTRNIRDFVDLDVSLLNPFAPL